MIHPSCAGPGALGPVPSCLRGSQGCGTSLGSITLMFLMPCSRMSHPQVVVEALAAFRMPASRPDSPLPALRGAARPVGTEIGSCTTRILFINLSRPAGGGRSSGRQPESRQRPVDVVGDCTGSKTTLLWLLAMSHIPRNRAGTMGVTPAPPGPAQLGESLYIMVSAF